MVVTFAVIAVFGALGALLVALGPPDVGSAAILSRAKRLSYVAGVALFSTFLVLVVVGTITLAFIHQMGNALEDTFSDSETEYSEYEDGPEFGENNEILPETEEEWEQFCSPDSGASEENQETYC